MSIQIIPPNTILLAHYDTSLIQYSWKNESEIIRKKGIVDKSNNLVILPFLPLDRLIEIKDETNDTIIHKLRIPGRYNEMLFYLIDQDHLKYLQILAVAQIQVIDQLHESEQQYIAPDELFYTFNISIAFWSQLFHQSFFCLGPYPNGLSMIPNPRLRCCVELNQDNSISSTKATTNKKVRRALKNGCYLTVNKNFSSELLQTKNSFSDTWLTDESYKMLCDIHHKVTKSSSQVEMLTLPYLISFGLYNGEDRLVATSIGYLAGYNFHDITAATFQKDENSYGRVLLRLQREYLEKCHIKLWYLGYELKYMTELSSKQFSPHEFFDKWNRNLIIDDFNSSPLRLSLFVK